MKANLLIFDFDGTLADSSKGIFESINFSLNKLGCAPASYNEFAKCTGMRLEEQFRHLLPAEKKGIVEEACKIYRQHYEKTCVEKTVLFPNVRETLAYFQQANKKMAIVTTKKGSISTMLLEALGIRHLFNLVIGGNQISKNKPDPEGINLALKSLKTKKEDAVIIGDSRFDITAGKNAGIKTIAVNYGQEKVLNADIAIKDFVELKKVIQ